MRLEVKKHAYVFGIVRSEGIYFIEVDHLWQLLPLHIHMRIKDGGDCSRRDVVSFRNGRECLVVIFQIIKDTVDGKSGNLH